MKISHDPNNLTWAQSAESYGQKLLSSQGWKPGQGLGARGAKHFNSPVPAIKVTYKDDNLGLGASLKSANPEHTRTGLDAFQGLLGRLNSKDEVEVKMLEQRSEDRKLALWSQGRWGGIMFVPGGLLVQGDEYRSVENEASQPEVIAEESAETSYDRAIRKAAKALRKAERHARREAKWRRIAESQTADPECTVTDSEVENLTPKDPEKKQMHDGHGGNPQPIVATDIEPALSPDPRQKRKKLAKERHGKQPELANYTANSLEGKTVFDAVQLPTPPSESGETPLSVQPIPPSSRNGRHIIRGRNIQAKRMAFADAKMLDEVGGGTPILVESC
jgi:Pin2-interacting protein X1